MVRFQACPKIRKTIPPLPYTSMCLSTGQAWNRTIQKLLFLTAWINNSVGEYAEGANLTRGIDDGASNLAKMYASRQELAAALVADDLFQGCLIDFFPPAFPVAASKGAAGKIGKQKPQPIGARDLVAAEEAGIAASQILHAARARQFAEALDADEIDKPDRAFRHVEQVLDVLRIRGWFLLRRVPAAHEDVGRLQVAVRKLTLVQIANRARHAIDEP